MTAMLLAMYKMYEMINLSCWVVLRIKYGNIRTLVETYLGLQVVRTLF